MGKKSYQIVLLYRGRYVYTYHLWCNAGRGKICLILHLYKGQFLSRVSSIVALDTHIDLDAMHGDMTLVVSGIRMQRHCLQQKQPVI